MINFLYVNQSEARVVILDFGSTYMYKLQQLVRIHIQVTTVGQDPIRTFVPSLE